MNSGNIVEISALVKKYGDNLILDKLDFQAKKSEIVTIIGASGSGKTTFLRCLNLLVLPNSGRMRVEDVDVNFDKLYAITDLHANKRKQIDESDVDIKEVRIMADRLRKKIGFLSQYFDLFLHKTIKQGIMLAPRIVLKYSRQMAEELAMAMLDKVAISPDLADRYPNQISGGQRQRAAMARSLAMKPDIMLYDEPTSALDPSLIGEIADMMRQLKRDGMTQIVVTHSMKLACTISDRLLEMQNGRLIEKDLSQLIPGKYND